MMVCLTNDTFWGDYYDNIPSGYGLYIHNNFKSEGFYQKKICLLEVVWNFQKKIIIIKEIFLKIKKGN